jgi:ATP synthase protein I
VSRNDNGRELQRAVRLREERRARWRREGERPFWRNLAVVGALGWLIVLPPIAGAFIGHWLDRFAGTGIMFSAGLIVAGAAAGFYLAWRRMHQE